MATPSTNDLLPKSRITIHIYQKRTKRSDHFFFFTYLLLFIISLFISTTSLYAQKPAECGNVVCTSNDVKIVSAKIADVNGSFFTCNSGDYVSGAYLYLYVTTNTPRVGAFVSLTLRTNNASFPVQKCFTGELLTGNNYEVKIALNANTFTCGSSAQLENIFTAWGTGNTDFCLGSTGVQCPATKSKCRYVDGEVIVVQTTPCTQPSLTAQPAGTTKCVGLAASFSASYNLSTDPKITTTSVWQYCTSSDCLQANAWADVPNSAPFSFSSSSSSNVMTSTLNINAVTLAMNGYKFRLRVLNTSSDATANPKECPQNSNTATLNVDQASSGGSAAAGSNTICAGNSTNITLSGNTGNIVKWQYLTSNSWVDINSTSNPLSSGILNITTQFRAVVQNGVCATANSTPATVTVDGEPSNATVGSTQSRCGTLVSASLGGNTPSTGTGTWSKKSGPGSVSFSAPNSGSSTATVSVIGTYVFTWTISNGVCNSKSADITVSFISNPPAPNVSYTPPTPCSDKYSVSINHTQNEPIIIGATYSIRDKNGNTIVGVLPGSSVVASNTNPIVFSNIPAGAGFRVTVTSASGECTSNITDCNNYLPPLNNQSSENLVQDAVSIQTIEAKLGSRNQVQVAPNPYNERIRFKLESATSGQGSLELFNLLGQKIRTVYQGYFEAGRPQSFDYTIPALQRTNLIYIFRVGNEKVTGKLLHIK